MRSPLLRAGASRRHPRRWPDAARSHQRRHSRRFVVRAPATDTPADIGPVDFVLFGVKAYDTDTAGAQAAPLIGDHSAIVTIQNGLDAPERLGNRYGAETGHFRHHHLHRHGRRPRYHSPLPPADQVAVAESAGSATPRLRSFVDALDGAGVGASSDDPMGILWDKFLWIGPVAALPPFLVPRTVISSTIRRRTRSISPVSTNSSPSPPPRVHPSVPT